MLFGVLLEVLVTAPALFFCEIDGRVWGGLRGVVGGAGVQLSACFSLSGVYACVICHYC